MKTVVMLAMLLAGCATAPTPRRTAPPLPPMPPLPRGAMTFQPAAVAPADGTMVGIYPFGPFGWLVVAHQSAGATLEMHWSDTAGGTLHLLASYGYSSSDQYVSAQIPADWPPYGRMFVRGRNLPAAPPSAFAAASVGPGIYTAHKVTVKGQSYRLVEISPAGAQFKMYRLVL